MVYPIGISVIFKIYQYYLSFICYPTRFVEYKLFLIVRICKYGFVQLFTRHKKPVTFVFKTSFIIILS